MSIKISGIKEISQKYSTYLFDLDGVIWSGQSKIKGGIETLNLLRAQNKRMFFITNSSIRNRQMLKERFKKFGFQANLEEIYPSDYVTTQYIKAFYPQRRKILVIGQVNLANQLKETAKQIWHLNDVQSNQNNTPLNQLVEKIDKSVDTVVFGYDSRMNYYKFCMASFHVQNGAKFIGTNPDKYTMNMGYKVPGNGSMLKSVEEATETVAQIPTKPNPFILNHLIETLNLTREDCLMIGDNLDTDIQFGINGRIDTLCVLTGNSTEEMVLKSNMPSYYTDYLM